MAEEDGIILWFTTISSNVETKKNQQRIKDILETKKIPFKRIDISESPDNKDRMREIVGDPKSLPPQLTNGDQYLGGFDEFHEAVETESLEQFLKLA